MSGRDEPRPYCDDGRTMTGIDEREWCACDPYPTWFRWERDGLIFPDWDVERDLSQRLRAEMSR